MEAITGNRKIIAGENTLNASKPRFLSNSTSLTVKAAGETVTVHRALWLKGDLDNNGIVADAGDVALMTDASIGKIVPDWRHICPEWKRNYERMPATMRC